MTQEIAEGHVEMKEILRLKDSILMLIVPIYGTFLCMLVTGGTFIFFMAFKIKRALKVGILCMSGAVIFYSSDSILAHGKFDTAYSATVSSAANHLALMFTYYVAQYLLGKAGLVMAEYMENEVL